MNNTKKKIIIFDDDEDILSICRLILEHGGWEVHIFTDCKNVEEKVSKVLPDVILMDNWIPDEGGVASTLKLKSNDQLKHIKVILFSANSAVNKLAEEAGADGFLEKPFELDRLEQVIGSDYT